MFSMRFIVDSQCDRFGRYKRFRDSICWTTAAVHNVISWWALRSSQLIKISPAQTLPYLINGSRYRWLPNNISWENCRFKVHSENCPSLPRPHMQATFFIISCFKQLCFIVCFWQTPCNLNLINNRDWLVLA